MSEEAIVAIVISILIFLLIREVMCWYWKINQNVALLTEIRDLLKEQGGAAVKAKPVQEQTQKPTTSNTLQQACEKCGTLVPIKDIELHNGKQLCPSCIEKYS